MAEITVLSVPKKKDEGIVRNINRMAESISDTRKYVTFAHSFGRCNTTSAVHGLGKVCFLRLLEKSAYARKLVDVFICPTSTKDNIKEAGEKLFLMLYGGKSPDSLADLRYAKYMKVVSKSVTVKRKTLPPTVSAAAFHAYRAFYQT